MGNWVFSFEVVSQTEKGFSQPNLSVLKSEFSSCHQVVYVVCRKYTMPQNNWQIIQIF